MKRRHIPARLLTLALLASFAVSACGIRGDLKTPPPLWGEDTRTEAEKADVEKSKAERAERKAAQEAAKNEAAKAE